MERVLLTVKEAAEAMGVSLSQAYEIIHQQPGFPALKFGPRSIRIPTDSLKAWLAGEAEKRVGINDPG